MNNREIVVEIGTPEDFVHGRLQKEGLAETERRSKTNSRVRNRRGIRSIPGAIFTPVGKMKFIEQARAYGGKQIAVQGLDFGWAFDTVGGTAVGGYIECLVCIF